MQMSGERTIAADRATVWAALNDPEVLKACIPGCRDMEKTSPTSFTATVVQKVGPVKATFTGEVDLSDIVEGVSYKITGRGKGGAAGAASGGADVRLETVGEGTHLTYEAEAKVTGKIAQLGARLINGFAKKMADEFFTQFQSTVEGAQNSPEIDETLGESVDDAIETARDFADQATDTARDFADQATDTAREFTDQAGEKAREFADKAGEFAGKASDAARDFAEKTEEATRSAAGNIAQKIEDAEPSKKGFWRRLFGG